MCKTCISLNVSKSIALLVIYQNLVSVLFRENAQWLVCIFLINLIIFEKFSDECVAIRESFSGKFKNHINSNCLPRDFYIVRDHIVIS